uniref:Uncharacterized protein n=1 Tax=Arundo donax TaxID=35708 RepID=A0A0A8XY37_ARUDO
MRASIFKLERESTKQRASQQGVNVDQRLHYYGFYLEHPSALRCKGGYRIPNKNQINSTYIWWASPLCMLLTYKLDSLCVCVCGHGNML